MHSKLGGSDDARPTAASDATVLHTARGSVLDTFPLASGAISVEKNVCRADRPVVVYGCNDRYATLPQSQKGGGREMSSKVVHVCKVEMVSVHQQSHGTASVPIVKDPRQSMKQFGPS